MAPAPSPPRKRVALALLPLAPLLIVPAILLGPIVLRGRVFLPQVPAALEPYLSEDPERAARAMEGMNYVEADRLFPVLSDQIAMRDAFSGGELPLWEPKLGLGVPLFAGSLAGASYPPNWLAFLLPPELAAGPLAALSLFLAALGAWLFFGRIGLSLPARLFGALAYQTGGFGIANLFLYMKVDAALYLPWALWGVEGLAQRKRYASLFLVLALTASATAGMPTITFFVGALSALYALLRFSPLARGSGRFSSGVGRAALGLVLGVVGGSVALLPMLETSQQSERQTASREEIAAGALPAATAFGIVLADFVGSPTEATPSGALPVAWWITPKERAVSAESANQLEWNTYAGGVTVVLALVALVSVPARALVPCSMLVLVLGFAQAWPLVRWLYALPGFNVGSPGRVLSAAWFLWPWLAALGIDAWIERRPRAIPALFGFSVLALGAGFAGRQTIEPESWARNLEQQLIERYDEAQTAADVHERLPLDGMLAAARRLDDSCALLFGSGLALLIACATGLLLGNSAQAFPAKSRGLIALACATPLLGFLPALPRGLEPGGVPPALQALSAVGLSIALAWASFSARELPRFVPLAVALLAEGTLAARGHVSGRPLDHGLFPPSAGIDAIREAAGDGRVIRYDASASGIADVENLARPNMLQVSSVADLTPWIVFPPRTFNALFAALDPRSRRAQGISRISQASLLAHPILDLVRAKAVLSREPLSHPRLAPVLERPGFCVYRRSGAFAPARVVRTALSVPDDEAGLELLAAGAVDLTQATVLAPEHAHRARSFADAPPQDAGRIAKIERPERGRIELEIESPDGAWLVLHEQHHPGWRASVNGEEVPLLRADQVYQAVRVPAGTSEVVFGYAPRSFRWGVWLTLGALALSAFLARRFKL